MSRCIAFSLTHEVTLHTAVIIKRKNIQFFQKPSYENNLDTEFTKCDIKICF